MSLEQKIEALTVTIGQLIAVLGHQIAVAPAPAPAPAYVAPIAPVAPAPMPVAPFQPAPVAPAAPAGLPFTDNVSAAAWATAAWQQTAAVNQDVAMADFGALMQAMGAADFNQLTPDKFPMLYQGVQALMAKLGIAG